MIICTLTSVHGAVGRCVVWLCAWHGVCAAVHSAYGLVLRRRSVTTMCSAVARMTAWPSFFPARVSLLVFADREYTANRWKTFAENLGGPFSDDLQPFRYLSRTIKHRWIHILEVRVSLCPSSHPYFLPFAYSISAVLRVRSTRVTGEGRRACRGAQTSGEIYWLFLKKFRRYNIATLPRWAATEILGGMEWVNEWMRLLEWRYHS